MIDIDELERINNAGDRYGHITPGVVAELIAEVRRLREEVELLTATQAACDNGSCEFDGCQKINLSGYRETARKWVSQYLATKADAGRYQWLKAHWGHRTPILNGLFPRGVVDDAFDRGIDMAIAKEKV